jgi:acyl-CoA synthetase (AMP-forming)/AMP-acid ligase II
MDVPTIADLLRAQAAERPDAVAVRFPVEGGATPAWSEVSFAALDRRADELARGLVAAGIRPGDRVLLLLRPSPEFHGLVFALVRAGAVPVFIDPGMGPRQALACVERIRPRAMIAAPAVQVVRWLFPRPFRSVAVTIVAGRRWLSSGPTLADLPRAGTGPFVPPPSDPDADAVLVFTSGSTGPAKAVAMTHRVLHARVERIREMLDLRPDRTVLETLLVYTVLEVCMGMSVVIPPMDLARPATVDPVGVIDAIRRFRPEVASASPVVWQRLVDHARATGTRLDGPRTLLTTAAPIPVRLHAQLADVFPADTQLFTPYGATEAMPIAHVGTHEVLADTAARTARGDGTCVGRLAPGMDVRIVRVTDEPLGLLGPDDAVADGQVGEILVHGDGVSPGYREAPEATALAHATDAEGRTWHRTGDLGWLDEQGRLWFQGRKGHRLETATGTIPAQGPEGVFDQHPDVRRSALVGLGPRGRERPVLCVELRDGLKLTPERTAAVLALAEGTPYAGLVTEVVAHPRFPTDTRHNSKIRREDLKRWLERRAAERPRLTG